MNPSISTPLASQLHWDEAMLLERGQNIYLENKSKNASFYSFAQMQACAYHLSIMSQYRTQKPENKHT